jgi:hypothetical protein
MIAPVCRDSEFRQTLLGHREDGLVAERWRRCGYARRDRYRRDGARRDLEIDPVERGHGIEAFGESLDSDREVGHRSSLRRFAA